jgi:hypothetical protein
MKTALKCKNDEFFCHASQKCTECPMPCKSPQHPKTLAIAHENGHKRKKDVFLVMPLKYVPSVMGLVNHPRTPKLWAIAHKSHKRKNDEFFVIPLQNVQTVIFLVNLHGTPKQWAIAHKMALKLKKRQVFLSCLSNVYRVSWPCKSVWNPKTVCKSS